MGRRAALAALALAACTRVGGPAAGPAFPPPRQAPPGPPVERPPAPRAPADPERRRDPDAVPAPVPRFGEVRALWVVRTTLTSEERIRAMVRAAHDAGFNSLLVQVRGRGDAYYRSSIEPRAEALDGTREDFDPLALVLEEAHARGLAVHAWVNTHLVWGSGPLPRDPAHLVRSRPELLAVPRPLARRLHGMDPRDPRYVGALLEHAADNRDRVEGVFTSPSDPEVQERVVRVWGELAARYALDGIHFDYVRYPSAEYDYSAGALEAFRAWVAPRLPSARRSALEREARRDPLAFVDALPEAWADFRRDAVTSLVRRVREEVEAIRPELVVSAAVVADPVEARRHRFQDWALWMEEGWLDAVAPMAYTPDSGRFRAQVAEAVALAGPARVWAGIGAWQDSFEGTVSKIRTARELGARGFSLFSYDWAAGQAWAGMSFLERVGREALGR